MLRNFLPAVSLLFFLLMLLTCCAICQPSLAEKSEAAGQSPLILFQENTVFTNGEDEVAGNKYKSFTFPSFSYLGDVLVLFAQAKEIGNGKKCDIVEGYFKVSTDGKLTDKFDGSVNKPLEKRRGVVKDNVNRCRGSPTTVFNNTHIFVFFNSSNTDGIDIKYKVISSQQIDVNKGITWEASPTDLTEEIKKYTKETGNTFSVSSGGSGRAINDSLILPVWYTKSENTDEFFSVIISASKSDEQQTWKLVSIGPSKKGRYPAVVEWGGKLIMMISCNDGIRKVYEYSKTQTTWTETVGPLSGVWGNTKERTAKEYGGQWGFIAPEVEIRKRESERKKVMFLTQPIAQPVTEVIPQAENKYELHLWMTDNQRVFDAGEIATGVGQDTSSTLLFEKDNLFVAYETGKKEQSTINVKYLQEKSVTIKHVLKTWDEKDKELLQSCFAADGTLTTADECTNDNKIPINGLVGFLSNNYSNKSWGDEYWCVNATVTEGEGSAKANHVKEGLKFSGAGVGAAWPVSKQEQNQPYYFVNRAFTLVATVKIDGEATGNKNSILGFVLQKGSSSAEKNIIGLWCSDGKWGVGDGKGPNKELFISGGCVQRETYQVALTFKDKTVLVYINGNKVDKLSEKNIDANNEKITHFYFGANNAEQSTQSTTAVSHVTVKNVLLYNRQFDDDEIGKLKPKQIKPQESIKTPKEAIKGDQRDENTAGGNSDEPTPPPIPTSTKGKGEDEKGSSPSRTEDGGVGGGVRVFSLLLPLLCVSAPLLHL